MFKITFLKFAKSWNVVQASKYFSMIFKSLLDCQKVQDNFHEVLQILKHLAIFKIFFYDFQKFPGLPEGKNIFSEVLKCLASFKIFLYDSYKSPGLPEGPK